MAGVGFDTSEHTVVRISSVGRVCLCVRQGREENVEK